MDLEALEPDTTKLWLLLCMTWVSILPLLTQTFGYATWKITMNKSVCMEMI